MAHWQSLSLVHVVICLTFLVLGLLVNLTQLLLTLTLPGTLFKRANYYLMYCVYGYLLFLGDWWSSSKLNVYAEEDLATQLESEDKGAENGLILMNHHTELDWLYSWMGADRLGVLGNCKVFAKDNLKFAPIIGWAWAMSDIIFLKRNWESDRENVANRLKTMFTAPSPVWLLLFPEGTRFSKDKHTASQEFAKKSGLPQLQHHLLPRTKGFSFVMERIDRTKVEAVYDVSLVEAPISHNPFSMPSILCGRPVEGSLLMRRLPVSDVPRDQEESAKWLVALWQEKDQLKENFLSTGSFGSKYRKVSHCRGKGSLLVFLGSNLLVVSGLLVALATGGLLIRSCLLASLAISWVAYHQLNSITSLAKASKHGLKEEASKS